MRGAPPTMLDDASRAQALWRLVVVYAEALTRLRRGYDSFLLLEGPGSEGAASAKLLARAAQGLLEDLLLAFQALRHAPDPVARAYVERELATLRADPARPESGTP